MTEFEFIQCCLRPLVSAAGAVGLQDDVAELKHDRKQVATLDTLVENVHFLTSDPLDTVAQKLIRVNVSDVCVERGETFRGPHEHRLAHRDI